VRHGAGVRPRHRFVVQPARLGYRGIAPQPRRTGRAKATDSLKRAETYEEGRRRERMRASPLWDGAAFCNKHPVLPGLRDAAAPRPTLSDFLCGGERRVPRRALPSADPLPVWSRKPASGLRVTWLGHSTALIEIGGQRILTDPVWGPRASPSRLVGPKRFQPVPVPLRALMEVDLVIISHDHYDHLDYPTIRRLAKAAMPIVTSLGVGARLERWGVAAQRICELDWWESFRMKRADLTVTATPSQHFSGRGLKDRNSTLWSSMAIRAGKQAVFFSGDTGLTTEFALIGERLGPFDLAMFEVGAFHPSWGDIHLGPGNALKAHRLLGSGAFLPVHWGTFNLALHAWDQPAEVLYEAGVRDHLPLLMPRLGEPVEPAQPFSLNPWWRVVDAGLQGDAPPLPSAAVAPQVPRGLAWPLD
jgi:L-ascorbate metabolism protein UlaG (beta-lactamase superfamily)